MKPGSKITKELLQRYPPAMVEDFTTVCKNYRDMTVVEGENPKRINKIRKTILRQLIKARDKKTDAAINAALQSPIKKLWSCHRLMLHVYSIYIPIPEEGPGQWEAREVTKLSDIIAALEVPYTPIPFFDQVLVTLCLKYDIAIEIGNRDFTRLASLMMEHLGDLRTPRKVYERIVTNQDALINTLQKCPLPLSK